MTNLIGQQVGSYRLTSLLGQGGFADVYLGEHIHLETQAAIKILHGYLEAENLESFRQEARTIARLKHPHIIHVFDFGIDANETPFLVMDYLPAGSILKTHPRGQRVPLPSVVSYTSQVAQALQYAHDARVIHRDVKPENLLLGPHQAIILSDFGIAVVAHRTVSMEVQNQIGTPRYMAPEQFRGYPTPASDQYSLAIMVYEWLCGECPFQGASPFEIGMKHLTEPVPSLRQKMATILPEIEQVVFTALAKDPSQRFGSVLAFATALELASQVEESEPGPRPFLTIPARETTATNLSQQSTTLAPRQPLTPSSRQTTRDASANTPTSPRTEAVRNPPTETAPIPRPLALRPVMMLTRKPAKLGARQRFLLLGLAGLLILSLAGGITWFIVHQASVGTITQFTVPTASSAPTEITAGPDGNLWFTEVSGNKIGRINPGGIITEFPLPTASSTPDGITAGPDGNLWFTEFDGNKIGHITTSGTITEFALPVAHSGPVSIAAGPDGNLWFTDNDSNKVGRITTSGTITEFAIPIASSHPVGITAGPDHTLWFTEFTGNQIGRITTSGTITEFATPTAGSEPASITIGPDGNLWFTEEQTDQIGRISPAGTITEFPLPTTGTSPDGITTGPDGNLWFTESVVDQIGRISPKGFITEFPLPRVNSYPEGITAGPDGNLWFTEDSVNKIGRITSGK